MYPTHLVKFIPNRSLAIFHSNFPHSLRLLENQLIRYEEKAEGMREMTDSTSL